MNENFKYGFLLFFYKHLTSSSKLIFKFKSVFCFCLIYSINKTTLKYNVTVDSHHCRTILFKATMSC